MKNIKLILALLVSLVVTACGGGGDPGVGSTNTPLYIDANNRQAVAATAIRTASGSTFELFNPENFSTTIYDAFQLGNITPQCNNNGEVASINTITRAGTIVYTNCTFLGKTFNGTVYLSNVSVSINPDILLATLTFNNFNITSSSGTTTLTGDYDMTATGLNTTYPLSFRANGNGAKLTLTKSGQSDVISNFNFFTLAASSFTTTYTSNFTLASSSLGGLITHQNITGSPYEKSSPNLRPSLGGAYVVGQYPTELRITVLSNENTPPLLNQVRVERSIDGGSSFPFFTDYGWSDFLPL
jgi:hypothetical protein